MGHVVPKRALRRGKARLGPLRFPRAHPEALPHVPRAESPVELGERLAEAYPRVGFRRVFERFVVSLSRASVGSPNASGSRARADGDAQGRFRKPRPGPRLRAGLVDHGGVPRHLERFLARESELLPQMLRGGKHREKVLLLRRVARKPERLRIAPVASRGPRRPERPGQGGARGLRKRLPARLHVSRRVGKLLPGREPHPLPARYPHAPDARGGPGVDVVVAAGQVSRYRLPRHVRLVGCDRVVPARGDRHVSEGHVPRGVRPGRLGGERLRRSHELLHRPDHGVLASRNDVVGDHGNYGGGKSRHGHGHVGLAGERPPGDYGERPVGVGGEGSFELEVRKQVHYGVYGIPELRPEHGRRVRRNYPRRQRSHGEEDHRGEYAVEHSL